MSKLPPTPKRQRGAKPQTGRKRKGDKADLHQKVSYLPDIHRLLPQAADAERGVICSFMLAQQQIGALLAEKKITPEHFHLPAHAQLFEIMLELNDAKKAFDFVTLTQTCRDREILDQIGGAAWVTELFTFLPTAANAGYYIEILQEKKTLRDIIMVCTEYAARSYDEQDDVASLLQEVESRILSIATDKTVGTDYVSTREVVMETIQYIEQRIAGKGKIGGIPTGFHLLDKMVDGLHLGEVFVIAARPSMGKTAIAMNIVEHVAIDLRIPCAVFSLEMSKNQLMNRAVLGRARCNWQMIREGYIADAEYPRITSAATQLGEAPIYMNDKPAISPAYLRAVLRRWVREFGIKVVMIDYLQLMKGNKVYKGDNKQAEIAEISAALKEIAKEFNVAVIALAQLNREVEKRNGGGRGKPRLSDLRDSGAIEQDADTVALLSREEVYAEDEEEKKRVEGEATLEVAKQRNGPLGPVRLTFLKEFTRFENRAEEVADHEQPELTEG